MGRWWQWLKTTRYKIVGRRYGFVFESIFLATTSGLGSSCLNRADQYALILTAGWEGVRNELGGGPGNSDAARPKSPGP
jgi:hypothetical protein